MEGQTSLAEAVHSIQLASTYIHTYIHVYTYSSSGREGLVLDELHADLMLSPLRPRSRSPACSPAEAAAPPVSTERMNTGALPLRENPNPPPPRFTCTSLQGRRRVGVK